MASRAFHRVLLLLLLGMQGCTEPSYQNQPMSHWLAQLEDPSAEARLAAAAALRTIGPPAKAALPRLVVLLQKDPDRRVRLEATGALWEIGPTEELVPGLIEALRSSDATIRTDAASVLWRVGPGARAAVPALMEALKKDKEWREQVELVEALRRIGPEAKAALPLLREVVQWPGGPSAQAQSAIEAIEKPPS